MIVNNEWYNDDPGGGGLIPEDPNGLNLYKDDSFMMIMIYIDDENLKKSVKQKIIYYLR